jgi:hypothetical protein
MTEPIKAGDLAEVVWGLQGEKSPNLGLIVKVVALAGEHSFYGRIWRCDAEYATRGQPGVEVPGGMTDFAQSWLRKIDPPAGPEVTRTKEVDHAA